MHFILTLKIEIHIRIFTVGLNIGEIVRRQNSGITVESDSDIMTEGSFEISEILKGIQKPSKVSRPRSAGAGTGT